MIKLTELSKKTAESVVKKMNGLLARFGISIEVRSGNSLCFVGEAFKLFIRERIL